MKAFYAGLLGLRVGPRRLTFPGVWLYVGDQAVLHVAGNIDPGAAAERAPEPAGNRAGFDHVAFRSQGLQVAKAHLDQAGVEWREVWRPHLDILQLVFHDPIGTKIELTFEPAEHPDWSPAGPASEVPASPPL